MIWYFAYASMVNPVSMRRRGMRPSKSLPGRLEGYALKFNVYLGMANLAPADGSAVHGVLHELSTAEFERLSEIEAGYSAETVRVTPYDAGLEGKSPVLARTFIFDAEHVTLTAALPTERYLKIMLQGLQHHGAHPDWIARIREQPCRLARRPEHYLKITPRNGAELPRISREELAQHTDRLPGVFALGKKVVEVDVSANPSSRRIGFLTPLCGTEATLTVCNSVYDPSLPELSCADDITDLHRAWAEDLLVEEFTDSRFDLRQIAWLSD
jgi:AIG2-like family